jgi:hypothetical protein
MEQNLTTDKSELSSRKIENVEARVGSLKVETNR